MICRARSTASDHRGDGSDCVTDGALCGCGCRGAAIAFTNITSPTTTVISPVTARTPSAARVLNQFLFFDIFTSWVDSSPVRGRAPLPVSRSVSTGSSRTDARVLAHHAQTELHVEPRERGSPPPGGHFTGSPRGPCIRAETLLYVIKFSV